MTDKKKVYIVINPASGTSSKEDLPNKISKILDNKKFEITFFITAYPGHGREIAEEAIKKNINYVIAVGGDGTVNEIGKSLVNTNVTLGIIPMGSGNGLARALKISGNIKKSLSTINEENTIIIDYGTANGHIFFCTCGFGFDAIIAKKVAGEKKRGSLMYFKNVLEAFLQEKPQWYEITCPEGSIKDKAFILTCANASQYGYNAHIAPQADIQDGLMNIALLKPLSILDIPQTTIQLFTKTIDDNKKMETLMTNQVIIKRENEGVMHIDGDPIHTGKEVEVKLIPKGLRVLVPIDPVTKRSIDPVDMLIKMIGSIVS